MSKNFFKKPYDSLSEAQKMAWDNRILWIVVGSNLYGTNTPTSDEDFMGVFFPTEEYVTGMMRINEVDLSIKSKKEDGRNDEDAVDNKFYEYRQYLIKAIDNNPNIVELLFVNNENIKFMNDFGAELLQHAHLFPHKGARQKFLGYATSQRKRMIIRTDHYKTLKEAHEFFLEYLDEDQPFDELREKRKMLAALFKDREEPEFMAEKKGHFDLGDLKVQKHLPVGKMAKMVAERISKASHRTGLMDRFGFDTKFGSHYIRLILEGIELLKTGHLEFPLKEAQLLLDIKVGKLSMKEVLDMGAELEQELELCVGDSTLPAKPRKKEVQQLCMTQLKRYLGYDREIKL